jgi:hypothetical protein
VVRNPRPSPAPESLPPSFAVKWRWVDLDLVPFAIAAALAPQRSLAPSAAPIALGSIAIASALATQRLLSSALEAAALRRTGAH